MKKILPLSLLIAALCGCQSLNNVNSVLSPKTRTFSDSFDGSKTVRQAPVSCASSLLQPWHTLGFEWNAKKPDKIYLTVGVHGINNIFGLDFNVGGQIITAETASMTTEYGPWSTRRFVVSYEDFKRIATAPSVKMKVSDGNTYAVSSFGTSTDALVGKKFSAFLEQVKGSR